MDFINSLFSLSGTTVVLAGAFVICFLGFAFGSIKIKGLSLGGAGVFLMALLFGYLFTLPALSDIPLLSKFFIKDSTSPLFSTYRILETIGLVLFVTSVGYIAGPGFFKNLKKNAKSYVPLGAIIVALGSILTIVFAILPGIGSDYSTGVLSGALTSTPAFSASKQVATDEGLVSLGHAVAYPFGVIGAVLFMQIMPRVLKADMSKERELIKSAPKAETEVEKKEKKRVSFDGFGLSAFGLAIVLGILLGSITIPITSKGFDGPGFSLGNTGGPLVMALVLGHFGHFGPISLKISETTLKLLRELGLVLFLVGAGVEGGVELVSQINASEYGAMIVVYGFLAGIIMTVVALLGGFFFARKVFKLNLLNSLGALAGGKTCTPSLGALIEVAGTEDVVSAYASIYPVSLILIVLASNLIGTFIA